MVARLLMGKTSAGGGKIPVDSEIIPFGEGKSTDGAKTIFSGTGKAIDGGGKTPLSVYKDRC